MAQHGKVGAVYVPDSISGTTITGETFSGDGTTTSFTLTNEYIKPGSETVTVDGAEVHNYKINYITGEITFEIAPASGTDNISVDYNYFTMNIDCGFFDWTINENADAEEATTFCSDGEREYLAGLTDWDGSANKYWITDEEFHNFVGEQVVIAFYIDETNNIRYEGWGIVTGVSVDVAVDSLVEESIDIQGSGKLEFRTT